MKYYLIYLFNGLVVELSSFDNEEALLKMYHTACCLEDYQKSFKYDNLQIFREVI